MNLQKKIRELLRKKDYAGVVALRAANFVVLQRNCLHEHPAVHRLFDFVVEEKGYRVCRCARCGDQIFVEDCEVAYTRAQIGVPMELTGWRLLRWVEEEADRPAEREVDWRRYLEMREPEGPTGG